MKLLVDNTEPNWDIIKQFPLLISNKVSLMRTALNNVTEEWMKAVIVPWDNTI